MTNVKITDLTEATSVAADDWVEIVDTSAAASRKASVANLTSPRFVPLTTPLTSSDWDLDSFSTTGKTLIDLSAVFGVPAGVKAVLVELRARDSGSASANCSIGLSPNDTHNQWALTCKPYDRPNDTTEIVSGIVPCDANGDIYYQTIATGSGTLDASILIWGYFL